MPQPGQKAVTVPEEIYEKVREEVKNGRERNITQTFVKAVNEYLARKYEFLDELKWLKENRAEIEKRLKKKS